LQKYALGNNGWTCVSDLKYDQDENLWLLNSFTNTPLKMLDKSGKWHTFETGGATINVFNRKLIVDNQNNKWFTVYGIGLVGFSDGGTFDDASDDVYRVVNDGLTSGALPSKEVTALAMDFNNQLWIGTDNGFCILYNGRDSDGFLVNQKFNGTCIILPFIEGFPAFNILSFDGYILLYNILFLITYLELLLLGLIYSGTLPISLLYSTPSLLVSSFQIFIHSPYISSIVVPSILTVAVLIKLWPTLFTHLNL
jgi:hypothetical protein